MIIPKINGVSPLDVTSLEQAFATLPAEPVACCNWAESFPYAPKVSFKMFHTGDYLMLRFEVEEAYTAALVSEDGGEVWTDSCVEFFMAFDDKTYYNLEATCIGKILLTNRISKTEGVLPASQELLDKIIRIPSMGTEPFEERVGENKWTLTLAIPPAVYFRHDIKDWTGVKLAMNLYKCGDNLSKPHFLSWKPIAVPAPNFHLPAFFAPVEFE